MEAQRDAKWQQLNSDGVAAYKNGDYPEAEKLFRLALAEAQALGQSDMRVASSLDSLAVVLEALQRYPEAERCYFESGDLKNAVYGQLHPEHLQNISDLAEFYLRIGDWQNPALLCQVFNVLAEEAKKEQNELLRTHILELSTELTKRVLELKAKVEGRATTSESKSAPVPEYLQLTPEEERGRIYLASRWWAWPPPLMHPNPHFPQALCRLIWRVQLQSADCRLGLVPGKHGKLNAP